MSATTRFRLMLAAWCVAVLVAGAFATGAAQQFYPEPAAAPGPVAEDRATAMLRAEINRQRALSGQPALRPGESDEPSTVVITLPCGHPAAGFASGGGGGGEKRWCAHGHSFFRTAEGWVQLPTP